MNKLLTECFYFSKSNVGSIFKLFGPYVIVTSLLSPFVELFYGWGNLFYLVVISFIHTYLMVRFIKFMAFVASGYPKEQTVSLNSCLAKPSCPPRTPSSMLNLHTDQLSLFL